MTVILIKHYILACILLGATLGYNAGNKTDFWTLIISYLVNWKRMAKSAGYLRVWRCEDTLIYRAIPQTTDQEVNMFTGPAYLRIAYELRKEIKINELLITDNKTTRSPVNFKTTRSCLNRQQAEVTPIHTIHSYTIHIACCAYMHY